MILWHASCNDIRFTKTQVIHYGEKQLYRNKSDAIEQILIHKKAYYPDVKFKDVSINYSMLCIDTSLCPNYRKIFKTHGRKELLRKRLRSKDATDRSENTKSEVASK